MATVVWDFLVPKKGRTNYEIHPFSTYLTLLAKN